MNEVILLIVSYLIVLTMWAYFLLHCMFYEENPSKRVVWVLYFIVGNLLTALYYAIKIYPAFRKRGKIFFTQSD